MKHTKIVIDPAREREVVDYITCDLCGDKIDNDPYDAEAVEVWHKTGSKYPDGGYGETKIYDICGKCFEEKLVAWMNSQNAKPTIEEWDY
jgi:hypothetical protein